MRPEELPHSPRRYSAVALGLLAVVLMSFVAACSPAGAGGGTVLTYSASGGLAGSGERGVEVREDGTVVEVPGGEVIGKPMSEDALDTLTQLTQGEAFQQLPPRTFEQPSPDAFIHSFEGAGKSVVADDTSMSPPLSEIRRLLSPWMSRLSG